MGQTVQELLTGVKQPLSHAEFVAWAAYFNVKADKQKKAQKDAQRSSSRGGRRR